MKTKTFLLLCLFLGMGLTQLSAQKGKNSTGSVVYDFYVGGVDGQGNPIVAIFPIFCDGIFVDAVSSTDFTVKVIDHFKNGELIWEISPLNNVIFTSVSSGEEFIAHGTQQKYVAAEDLFYLHYNLNGNNGNHYIIHMVIQGSTGDIVEVNSNCH